MHPHDIADIHLAPVALTVDARVEELGRLGPKPLRQEIALAANHLGDSPASRAHDLLVAIGQFIDLEGWGLSWDPRGIRLSHDEHTVVIGVASSLADFVAQG